jgi:hypothetical protein
MNARLMLVDFINSADVGMVQPTLLEPHQLIQIMELRTDSEQT